MLDFDFVLQGTRMEERLDDAINVLRNHAESQLGLHAALASVTHSTPLYPHGIDSTHAHLVSHTLLTSAVRTRDAVFFNLAVHTG